MSTNEEVQQDLRTELRSCFATAHVQSRVPTSQEITATQSHYLDACIEEVLRCATTAIVTSRRATTDALVLGHIIPQGTKVLFMGHGGGILKKPSTIHDDLRSTAFRSTDNRERGTWDVEDIDVFNPRRWLTDAESTGLEVFDPSAGPHIAFGSGPRGCFGKKLAYLELKIAMVLLVWNFEMQSIPEAYSSWEARDHLTVCPARDRVQQRLICRDSIPQFSATFDL
jgi:cytochrome P450